MMAPQERLTEEQIRTLLHKYRTRKDRAARDKLVAQYKNLVESIARRYSSSGEPVEDLAQEGYIGLISALEGFDTTKGVKFSTYATHFVIGQIKHYIRDKGKIIKEPAWLQEVNARLTKTMDKLSQQYGRQPTESEISQVMNIPEEEVVELLRTREVFKVTTIDGGERDDNNGYSSDSDKVRKKKADEGKMPIEEKMVLHSAVDRLKNIEQEVIQEYFFKDLNQTEIANKLGISCNYVSHILRNSTRKLRKMLTTEDIREVQMRLQALQKLGSVTGYPSLPESITDTATDTYSREYYIQRLDEEISRGIRHGYPVAAMLLTLEYMSDREKGWAPMTIEERLYTIAQNIRHKTRKADILARYTENQFGLILPHTGDAGERVCERIIEIVTKINDRAHREILVIRGSLTFASCPANARSARQMLDLLEKSNPLVTTRETEITGESEDLAKAA